MKTKTLFIVLLMVSCAPFRSNNGYQRKQYTDFDDSNYPGKWKKSKNPRHSIPSINNNN